MTKTEERKLWSVAVITWVGEMFGKEPDGDTVYGLALGQRPELTDRIEEILSENMVPTNYEGLLLVLQSLTGPNSEELIEGQIKKIKDLIEINEALVALHSCVRAFSDPLGYSISDTRSPAERDLAHLFDPVHLNRRVDNQ